LPGIVCAPFTHRSTLTGTKDTGSAVLVAPLGQPTHAGSPGTAFPPLTVGTGVADADGPAGAVACPPAALLAVLLGAALFAVLPGAALLAVLPGAAPVCALPHPAASAPATSSGTATAAARRPARALDETRAIEESGVLMPVPRFCGTPLRRPRPAHGFTHLKGFTRPGPRARLLRARLLDEGKGKKHFPHWEAPRDAGTEGTTKRPRKTTVNGTLLCFSFPSAPVKLEPCTTMTWL
jgi:hypothetical protein